MRLGTGFKPDTDATHDGSARDFLGAQRITPGGPVRFLDAIGGVGNQGATSTCVGWAFVECIALRAAALGLSLPRGSELGVRNLALELEAVANGKAGAPITDTGCQPSLAVQGIRQYGLPTQAAFPFDPAHSTDRLTLSQLEAADKLVPLFVRGFYGITDTGESRIPTGPPTTAGDGIIWSDTHGVHFTNHSDTSPYSSAIGWDSTISGDALWLNPASSGSFTDASMVLGSNGGSATVLNTGTTGGLTVGGSSGASAVWNAQGFAIGNPSTEQASGSAILQFAPGTVPTSCSTSLSACIYDNSATASVSNGLVSMDSKGNRTTLAPQVATLSGTGTSGVDTQVLSDGAYVGFGKTVGNQTLILSSPILSGSACDVDWTCIARVIVAGTAPTTLGNALIQREIDGVTNIAGTVALAGGATTVLQNKAPGGWGSLPIECTPSYATANTYTIMAQSCANCGTVDWTIKAKLNCQ